MPDLGHIDLDNIPDDEFLLIDPGYYNVIIESTEAATSQNGDEMIKVTLRFMDDQPFANRVLWDHWSFTAQSDGWVNMSKRKLKQAAGSLGIKDVKDSSQLHGQPLRIKVSKKNDRNNVDKYLPFGGEPAPAVSDSQQKKKPWE